MSTSSAALQISSGSNASCGGQLVATDGRTLPLRSAALRGDACAGLARVTLIQEFFNPYDEPLTVTYSLPMPAEGAVSGFAFEIGERRIVGEVDSRNRARQRFEEAIVAGHTAAILEQDRSTLFTQEVGNIPPRQTVRCEISVDQKLLWRDATGNETGGWEWRFPTVVAPRYMGAPGRVQDNARVSQDIVDGAIATRMSMTIAVRDRIVGQASSPSHPLHIVPGSSGTDISLSQEGGVRLDREIVVRWPVAENEPGITLDLGRGTTRSGETHVYGLLTVTPPREALLSAMPRDLIVLLDTSGSMEGQPLEQAKRVVAMLIETLGSQDQLEMIEFSDQPRRWKKRATVMDPGAKRDGLQWLSGLNAGSSTEMHAAVMEAMRPLRADSQRQIVLLTDGLIGFEQEIIRSALDSLPRNCRLHTVGIGSAPNRSLIQAVARAGRGVELLVGIGEDAEKAAQLLQRRTTAPVLVDLEIKGDGLIECGTKQLPDLYSGSPVLIPLKLRPNGRVTIRAQSKGGGIFEYSSSVDTLVEPAPRVALPCLFAREKVEDFEMRVAAGEYGIDPQIEQLGLEYQIATRLTSWIAVSHEPTVDPREPSRRERMPHELAHGMSIQGLGLRRSAGDLMNQVSAASAAPPPPPRSPARSENSVLFSLNNLSNLPKADQERSAAEPKKQEEGSGLIDIRAKVASPTQQKTAADLPAPEKKRGILSRIVDAFKGSEEEETRWTGCIVLDQDGELTIEITVGEEVDWQTPEEVLLELANGKFLTEKVAKERSTRDAHLSSGTRVRIVVSCRETLVGLSFALGDRRIKVGFER